MMFYREANVDTPTNKEKLYVSLANCHFGTTGHVTLFVLNTRRIRPYVHPLNVADFKAIHAG